MGGAHTSDEGVTPETEQSCQENSVKETVYLSINKNDGLMKSRTETTKESLRVQRCQDMGDAVHLGGDYFL